MEGPKVSIIIPVYNLEGYLERTLTSIINQTFSSLELVLVNDGSTDNTLKVATEILSQSNIDYQIIDQSNQGVSQARNAGINTSQGEYLFFLDGDDYLKEDCVEKLYDALIKQDCQAAYAHYRKVTSNGEKLDTIPQVQLPETSSAEYLMKLELTMAITFSFCQILYPRRVVADKKIYFNPELRYGEDTDFALRVLSHLNCIAYVPEDLIYYVQRETSSSKKALLDRYDFIKALDEIKEYYRENNISEHILKLIDTNRIPKSIMGNTNFLLDQGVPLEEVVGELRRRGLLSRLKNFQPTGSQDYRFLIKTKLFATSPLLYYHLRQLL